MIINRAKSVNHAPIADRDSDDSSNPFKDFVFGIAQGLFTGAYISYVEENPSCNLSRPGPGEDWAPHIPATLPRMAFVEAGIIVAHIGRSMCYTLISRAEATSVVSCTNPTVALHELAGELGWYIAMQSMQYGMCWTDSHPDIDMPKLPYTEINAHSFEVEDYEQD